MRAAAADIASPAKRSITIRLPLVAALNGGLVRPA
jgi:hypothetical protein